MKDPDLNLSPATMLHLHGMGVYLDGPLPIPERLRREVDARWAGYDESYESGWKHRDVLACYAMRPLVDEVAYWREDSRWWRRAAFIASVVAIGAMIALVMK